MSPVAIKTTDDGRSTRWESHRAERRLELARAARKAVHQHGPEISMDEIATYAGTSKSIVYRYFVDKPGLQTAVGEAVVKQIQEEIAAAAQAATTPEDALWSMVEVYLSMIEHSPNVYYFVTHNTTVPFLESLADTVAKPFAQTMAANQIDAAAWGTGAVGFIRSTSEWWLTNLTNPAMPTKEELTNRIANWLWSGIRTTDATDKPHAQR